MNVILYRAFDDYENIYVRKVTREKSNLRAYC